MLKKKYAKEARVPRRIVYYETEDFIFSETDARIVEFLALDYTSDQIGKEVCLSPRTVQAKIEEMYDVMNVRGKAGLVLKAITMGIISMPLFQQPADTERTERAPAVYDNE